MTRCAPTLVQGNVKLAFGHNQCKPSLKGKKICYLVVPASGKSSILPLHMDDNGPDMPVDPVSSLRLLI